MRRILALLAALLLFLTLVACTEDDQTPTDSGTTSSTTAKGEPQRGSSVTSMTEPSATPTTKTTALTTTTTAPTATTTKKPATTTTTTVTTQAVANLVPEGWTYYVGAKWDWDKSLLDYATAKIYIAGEPMPEELTSGDTVACGDYYYRYVQFNEYYDYWSVYLNLETTDRNKTSYGKILSSIRGVNVESMYCTFSGCVNLVTAPAIPEHIKNMQFAFSDCSSLTAAPAIPDHVTDIGYAFMNCTSLKAAPAIPSSVSMMDWTFSGCTSLEKVPDMTKATGVDNMSYTFSDCTKLSGEISINGAFTWAFDKGVLIDDYFEGCFMGTTRPITIVGSVSDEIKAALAASAENGNVTY